MWHDGRCDARVRLGADVNWSPGRRVARYLSHGIFESSGFGFDLLLRIVVPRFLTVFGRLADTTTLVRRHDDRPETVSVCWKQRKNTNASWRRALTTTVSWTGGPTGAESGSFHVRPPRVHGTRTLTRARRSRRRSNSRLRLLCRRRPDTPPLSPLMAYPETRADGGTFSARPETIRVDGAGGTISRAVKSHFSFCRGRNRNRSHKLRARFSGHRDE